MRMLAKAAVFLITAPCWAQSVSTSDGIVSESPGITVRVIREASLVQVPDYCCCVPQPLECRTRYETVPALTQTPGSAVGVDAASSVYHIANSGTMQFADGDGTVLQRRSTSGVTENVVKFYRERSLGFSNGVFFSFIQPFYFDVTAGRIEILVGASVRPVSNETDFIVGIVEISGLPRLFDTLLTFVPGQQALNVLTPEHPDGFRSTDSLQVWIGNVRSMPDWSQAEPLTCEAATSPIPGQLVTVPDTLPAPAIGEGRYYLVATQSGADRRLGRQYVNRAFSAREPTGLPICQ